MYLIPFSVISFLIDWIFSRRPRSLRASSSVGDGSAIGPLARTPWMLPGASTTAIVGSPFERGYGRARAAPRERISRARIVGRRRRAGPRVQGDYPAAIVP